ncbi:GNAT family N-acetyltransferase [Pseudonocardia endophytica]|uniref:Putative N-acetyltransferase YhbS n=1 Tax=Pseudonocardia endophytica TaxID=401976 RepID=A0A4R1HXJ2_PSEEN|nr:GNAT family N-acetyltransferase [Pseudonocardia endophytica]TCK24789.1 putative N-acetyltransferase YhbS [Pseudonocardia endophytica]
MPPVLRTARPEDAATIEEVMRRSVLTHFPAYYDERQTASAARFTARLDPMLVDDGTYLVHEVDGEIVSCGGWSRRAKLFAGPADAEGDDPVRTIDPATEPARIRAMFVREGWARRGLAREILQRSADDAARAGFGSLVLVATLAGVPLYRAFGFAGRETVPIVHPDGVELEGLLMDRAVSG